MRRQSRSRSKPAFPLQSCSVTFLGKEAGIQLARDVMAGKPEAFLLPGPIGQDVRARLAGSLAADGPGHRENTGE